MIMRLIVAHFPTGFKVRQHFKAFRWVFLHCLCQCLHLNLSSKTATMLEWEGKRCIVSVLIQCDEKRGGR